MKNICKIFSVLFFLFTLSTPVFASFISSSNYKEIQDEGTPLTKRSTVNFTGAGVACADSGGITVCTVSSAETDPVYSAWDKSTGISITESQISDLQAYLLSETDPVYTAWDKSTGISITESQISDLQAYLLAADIDTSAELATILTDETGTGAAVFASSPTLSSPKIESTGVQLSGSNGSITMLGLGDGADEDLKIDLNVSSIVEISSSTNAEIFAFLGAAVTNPFSGIDNAAAWGRWGILSGTNGGARFRGYSDTGSTAIDFEGLIGSTNPADNIPAVKIIGSISNGAGSRASMNDAEDILSVQNNFVEKFRIEGNGNTTLVGAEDFTISPNTTADTVTYSSTTGVLKYDYASTDVTHSMTGELPTNTWGQWKQKSGSTGGITITGATDSDVGGAILIRGYLGVTDPTDTYPAFRFVGAKYNGTTGVTYLGSAETVYTVENNGVPMITTLGTGTTTFGTSAFNEDFTIDVDDVANEVTFKSTTGVTNLNTSSISKLTTSKIISTVDSRTINDSGDGNPATLSLEPTSSYVEITCSDVDTCDITMSETNATVGQLVTIINIGTNVVDFSDSAGVSELAGAFAAGQYDSITLRYATGTWVETSRSDN